jgi:hypothetical protein
MNQRAGLAQARKDLPLCLGVVKPLVQKRRADDVHKFPDKTDQRTFFRFSKDLILDGTWAGLPPSSKAIFPVIGVHCDCNTGEGWPNEETIAILSGVTPKTVRDGIKGLEALPGFSKRQTITARGHRKNIYKISIPIRDEDKYFFFYKQLLDSGNWYHLSQTAKALYPVMRTYAFFDPETFDEYGDKKDVEKLDDMGGIGAFGEFYRNRRYDFCNAHLSVLFEKAGMSPRSFKSTWKSLAENCMAALPESNVRHIWKVYIRTPLRQDARHMNAVALKRYGKTTSAIIQ